MRKLSEEKDSLRNDIEFAKSLSTLIQNPESFNEADMSVLSERFDQARMVRSKGARLPSNSKTRAVWQRLLSTIVELSKT